MLAGMTVKICQRRPSLARRANIVHRADSVGLSSSIAQIAYYFGKGFVIVDPISSAFRPPVLAHHSRPISEQKSFAAHQFAHTPCFELFARRLDRLLLGRGGHDMHVERSRMRTHTWRSELETAARGLHRKSLLHSGKSRVYASPPDFDSITDAKPRYSEICKPRSSWGGRTAAGRFRLRMSTCQRNSGLLGQFHYSALR
jgi:hypothetical protein